ncbi:tRNA lysidine(34) synthetase TilS [Caulobacter ginsengisoli]|uniref:tRNA lysidine(34) synthetase TilS n=1 Tax=Caulobacter ginsengisoli TaxID=400775 RepID=UPI0027D7B965|nr:tRNA lysidine(34) synthetase TilS [Caulobacter ginsengisoli]
MPASAFAKILGRRLSATSVAPVAVAFSGGGDSLALLLAARDWGRRRLVVLTVDHGLNPQSAAWTRRCGETAARLGLEFRALAWTGEKPATGLPAAARAARHALLADAAREAGARVILMGHTASDLTESAAMRAEGSTVPDAREWGPSPAWPEGRGVFLFRPMLGLARDDIRDWLRTRGETWIDDPANEDVKYARARARKSSPGGGGGPPRRGGGGGQCDLHGSEKSEADRLRASAGRGSHTDPLHHAAHGPPPPPGEDCWFELPRATPLQILAAACLCAAGTTRPPRGDRLQRLADRLATAETFTATLAGARIEARPDRVLITRDAGELSQDPTPLPPNQPIVWDGRFELTATQPGLTVRPLAGLSRRLPATERAALTRLPAAVRPGLPVIVDQSGAVSCPILAGSGAVRCEVLTMARFDAAIGLVQSEPDM